MQALGKKKEPDIVVTIGQKSTQYIDGKDPQATIIFNTHNGSNTLVEDSIPGILVWLSFGCHLEKECRVPVQQLVQNFSMKS